MVVKIHFCRDCALKLIATAHTDLDGLLRSLISGDWPCERDDISPE